MSFLKNKSVIKSLILNYSKKEEGDDIKKSDIFPVESYPDRN